jgi:hypothetical protein
MTISAETAVAGPYNGNGSTTAFAFSFKCFSASDVDVYLEASTGTQTLQTLTTHYSVSLNSDQDASPGGTVTMVTAPASGEQLHIVSGVPYTRTDNFSNAGGFYPNVLNDARDKTTLQIQQLLDKLGRAVIGPVGDTFTSTLPSSENRANKFLSFDSNGNPTVANTLSESSVSLGDGWSTRLSGALSSYMSGAIGAADQAEFLSATGLDELLSQYNGVIIDVVSTTIIDVFEGKGADKEFTWIRRRFERKTSTALNYDVWLITSIRAAALQADGTFKYGQKIEAPGAHDFAIRENGKADFMGGTAHGNEVITGSVALVVDGESQTITAGARYVGASAYLEQTTIFYEYISSSDYTGSELGRCTRRWEFRDTTDGAMRLHNTVNWDANLNTTIPGFSVDFAYLAMYPYDGTFFTKTNWEPGGTLSTHANANVTYPGTSTWDATSITIQNDDGYSVTVAQSSGWPSGTATGRDTLVSTKRKVYMSYQGQGSGSPVTVADGETWAVVTEYTTQVPTVTSPSSFGDAGVTLSERARGRRTSAGNGEIIFESTTFTPSDYFSEGDIVTFTPSATFSNGSGETVNLAGEYIVQIVDDASDKIQIQAPGGDWEDLADDTKWTSNATPYLLCELSLNGGGSPAISSVDPASDLSVTCELRWVRNSNGNLEVRYQNYTPGRDFTTDWSAGDTITVVSDTYTNTLDGSTETVNFSFEMVIGSIIGGSSTFYVNRSSMSEELAAEADKLDDGWTSDATVGYQPALISSGSGSNDWQTPDFSLADDVSTRWVFPPDTDYALVSFESDDDSSASGVYSFKPDASSPTLLARGGAGTVAAAGTTTDASGTDTEYTLKPNDFHIGLSNRRGATVATIGSVLSIKRS